MKITLVFIVGSALAVQFAPDLQKFCDSLLSSKHQSYQSLCNGHVPLLPMAPFKNAPILGSTVQNASMSIDPVSSDSKTKTKGQLNSFQPRKRIRRESSDECLPERIIEQSDNGDTKITFTPKYQIH